MAISADEALQQLGLTPNEIKVYTYLARTGVRGGAMIVSECGLDKSSTYRALKDLATKGLVYAIGETRNQSYGAYPTATLMEVYERRVEQLAELAPILKSFGKSIDEYTKESYSSSHILLFSGKRGYEQWNEERLRGKVNTVREFLPDELVKSGYVDYYPSMTSYLEQRVAKKIEMRTLMNAMDKADWIDRSRKDFLKEVRILPASLNLPAGFSTFGDRVGFITKDRGGFLGVVIHDAFITEMMVSIFDFMWKTAQEVLPDETK